MTAPGSDPLDFTVEIKVLEEWDDPHFGKLHRYPPPGEQPGCRCTLNPMAAMVCGQGHLTECHVGMSCDVARCSHLPRYYGADELPGVERMP